MFKTVIFIICIFLYSQISHGQEFFEYTNPNFSFSIPEDWKEYHGTPSLLIFDKFVKVNDGIIGGILRVGKDVYNGNLETVWSIKEEEDRKILEKEASIRNYSFKRETLNGTKTVKTSFDTSIGEKNKRKDFKGVIYKFLTIQDNKQHVVTFFLITDPKDFDSDHNDVLEIVSTLDFGLNQKVYNSERIVEFNQEEYVISKPSDYDYFSNSSFKDMKINEFTNTYCFTDEIGIYDFELLVPKKLDEEPLIHFYTMNSLKGQEVTAPEYIEAKIFWKEMYNQPNYNELVENLISDSLLFCNYDFSKTDSLSYIHLKDEANILSTLIFNNSKINGENKSQILITNYIYINDIVVYIKLSQAFTGFSDIDKIKTKSNTTVSEFLKNNIK